MEVNLIPAEGQHWIRKGFQTFVGSWFEHIAGAEEGR